MSQEVNSTLNGSLVDPGDIFAETESSTYYSVLPRIYEISQYLKFFVDTLALATDIYLIVIISKFKALKTRINHFILQYAIYNILFLVLANLLVILVKISNSGRISTKTFFFLNSFDVLTANLGFLVLTFMASDWFVSNYHPTIYNRFQKYFKHGSYIMVSLATIVWIPISIICYVDRENLHLARFVLEETLFIFCCIVIISITILKKRRTLPPNASKNEYALTIPRIVFILAAFLRIFEILFVILENDQEPDYFYDITYLFFFTGEILLVASPVVVVYQLMKINKHFKSAYIKSFKKKRVHNYDDDDLDTDSVTDALASNVCYDKDAEAIVT